MIGERHQGESDAERHGGKSRARCGPGLRRRTFGNRALNFEADDLAGVGKVFDGIYADPEMVALMTKGAESASWESSILLDLPMTRPRSEQTERAGSTGPTRPAPRFNETSRRRQRRFSPGRFG